MDKHAKTETELKPHQRRVVERIKTQPGLVVAHGLGSGKTLTSLAASEELGGDTSVVVPASLIGNYKKEITKHIAEPEAKYQINSLQAVARGRPLEKAKLQIVDEAHRLRNVDSQSAQAIGAAEAEKRLLLTGTPLYNRPHDLASLVNIAAGDRVLPDTQEAFDKAYVEHEKVNPSLWGRVVHRAKPGDVTKLKNTDDLGQKLRQWVDYHENSTEGFPERRDRIVEVPMGKKQQEVYKALMKDAPAWARYKLRRNLPPSKQEAKQLNAFLSGVRQASNSAGGFSEEMTPEAAAADSPKIRSAIDSLKQRLATNKQHRAIVYSNFLQSGIDPYEAALKQEGIAHGRFTGDMPHAERDAMVRQYNAGELPVLMLSSAGGEGLDLKGTRQIQVLEPHFNKEKLEQVIARGIRYQSHEHLDPKDRVVDVEHYVATPPAPGTFAKLLGRKRDTGADEYLRTLSKNKDTVNQQVRDLLRQEEKVAMALDGKDVKLVSRVVYEANRALSAHFGDESHKPFDPKKNQGNVVSVSKIVTGDVRSPQQLHDTWAAQRMREGWTYGPTKDPKKKTHPSLVPYAKLPPDEKAKDRLFLRVTQAMEDAMTTHKGQDVKTAGVDHPVFTLFAKNVIKLLRGEQRPSDGSWTAERPKTDEYGKPLTVRTL